MQKQDITKTKYKYCLGTISQIPAFIIDMPMLFFIIPSAYSCSVTHGMSEFYLKKAIHNIVVTYLIKTKTLLLKLFLCFNNLLTYYFTF